VNILKESFNILLGNDGNPLSGLSEVLDKITKGDSLAALSSILFFIVIYAVLELGAHYLSRKGSEKKLLKNLQWVSFSFALLASLGFFVIAKKYDLHLASMYFISFVLSLIASFILGYYISKVDNLIKNNNTNGGNTNNNQEKKEIIFKKILYGALLFFLGISLGLSGFFLEKTTECFKEKGKCEPKSE